MGYCKSTLDGVGTIHKLDAVQEARSRRLI